MTAIAEKEPLEITAGDYIQWKRVLSDYPAGTWTLSYALINATDKITITAANSGGDHLVTLAAATSADYTPGEYKWQAYVTSGSQRITVASGTITIKPDFSSASALDNRTHVKKTLDAIEAVIEGRASQDQQEYSIANRSLKRTPLADLLMLRDKYRGYYLSEQNAENIRNGFGGKNRILVRI
jgi:hypothetical protein